MRATKVLLGSVVAATFALVTGGASADPPAYKVAAASGTVTITPNAPWHVNTDYPWKLVCGSTITPKGKFASLTEAGASATGSGACQVKGGVCNGGQCQNFTENVNL